MKSEKNNSGQLIIVAGFLVAIAIVGVAITFTGLFYTQGTQDSSVERFSSSVVQQEASATSQGIQSLQFSNLYSEKKGLTTHNLSQVLVNYMKNYTKATQNATLQQAKVNVSLNNATINRSWLAGKKKPGVLPGIHLNNTNTTTTTVTGRNPFDVVFVLDTTASMGFDYDYNTFQNSQNERYADVDGGYNGYYDDTTFSEGEVISGWSPSSSSYYEDPSVVCDRSFNSDQSHQNDDLNEEYCDKEYVDGDDASNGGGAYDVDVNDTVLDTSDGEVGEALQSRTQTSCGWWSCYTYTEWQVDKPGGKEWVPESDLEDRDVRYRYWVPKKMYYAKQATKTAIGALNGTSMLGFSRGDRAGIVEFDDNNVMSENARILQTNGEELLDISSSNKNDLNDTVDTIYDNYGSTYIAAGIEKARDILNNDGQGNGPGDADHIVVLSDGKNSDVDGSGDNSDEDQETRDQSNMAESEGMTIHSVALGDGADDALLQDITTTNGTFEDAGAGQLVDIFEEIIGNIQTQETNTTTITQPTQSEAVKKIYELRLNVTEFNTRNQVSINITNTTNVGGVNITESIWKLTVDNRGPTEYALNLTSSSGVIETEEVIYDDINASDTYVSFDVMNNEVRNQDGDVSFDLHTDIIENELPVSFALENGEKNANGTFRFEFEPTGNYSVYNDGSGMGALCPNPGPCGYENNTNSTYSTAKVRSGEIVVNYQSAQGEYTDTIKVDNE